MSVILDRSFERTLDVLVKRISSLAPKGEVQAWVFDDLDARQKAAAKLADQGITARFFSAYKPLVHFFVEDEPLKRFDTLEIIYPLHEAANEKRFILEAYPLGALAGANKITFTKATSPSLNYEIKATSSVGAETFTVFAPNRQHLDHLGDTQLSPTGWLRIPSLGMDEAIETDFEQIYAAAITAIKDAQFGKDEPYFEELNIRIALPATDQSLGWGDETLSLKEAMHEDVFFSILEHFQAHTADPQKDRTARPGHIVPLVANGPVPSVRIETRSLSTYMPSQAVQPLETATHPLGFDQIETELTKISGTPLQGQSRAGRLLPGLYKSGSDAGIIISGAQHANETTGVIGALRATQALAKSDQTHFAVMPVENPDGYALHHRLRAENPTHMHHAARYSGFGDDIGSRKQMTPFEDKVRKQALTLSGAKLHLNLHGYPAHEWTRPLSGYVPRKFELWTIPKGFFLIMRHHKDWTDMASALMRELTKRLAKVPGLVEYNAAQIKAYEMHAGPAQAFSIQNGIPVSQSVYDGLEVPLALITEFPDETIYGENFILGHTVQMHTVLEAYAIYQDLVAGAA